MRVQISDSVLLGDLANFLQAAECRVRKVGEATLDVTMPRAPSAEQAQREIDIYLKTWQAMHPGSYARIVREGSADTPT
jgi:MOSC domain-containing protein YiiM